MAYIRLKSIKGKEYAYLVESIWDKEEKQPKQVIIKYLGRVDRIDIDDIPEEYKSDPRILDFINRYRLPAREDMLCTISRDIKEIVDMLSSGDIKGLLDIFKGLLAKGGNLTDAIIKFYEEFIIPALEEVGELWMQNRLGIAVEHVCSNTANSVIKNIAHIASNSSKSIQKGKVILATPTGELHNIACNMLESILVSRGYKVYNISPSVPRDVIIRYIEDVNADALLVSITLTDSAKLAERLVKTIRGNGISIPIIVGGRVAAGVRSLEDLCIVFEDRSFYPMISIIDREVSRYRGNGIEIR